VEFQRELEAGKRVVVGVNRYVEKGAPKVEVLRIDEKVRAGRIRRIESIKKKRDAGRARAALARLDSEARGKENLMEPVLEAVRASVTLGEICHALRKLFGTHDASRPA
jgi:methylmalonyl-CoA mutase N-terminal domain/subunit